METNDKTISALNSLIEINNDRIEGYELAARETEDGDLKRTFSAMADESRGNRSELITEVISIGGVPTEGSTTSGKVYRAWMDLKSAVTGKNRHAIISSCEFGEDAALDAYKDELEKDLPSKSRELVQRQSEKIRRSHDRIKAMRDTADTH